MRRIGIVTFLGLVCLTAATWATVAATGASEEPGAPEHLFKMVLYASVALVFSFLCSVAEAVVLSVSPSYIAHLKQGGRRSAALLERIKTEIDKSLAGILTLNTIAHTVGAGGAGAEAAAYFGDRFVGLSMAVLTVLILFLSEIIPKTLGALYWRRLAIPTAMFVRLLNLVLMPLIWISEILTSLITRGRKVHGMRREEFIALADVGERSGQLEPGESRILRNLFRFPDLHVEDIMTPRPVVFSLHEDLTVAETVALHPEIPFSRIPIFRENRDDVTGLVLKTEILLAHLKEGGHVRLREIKRAVDTIVETASLAQAAEELLGRRTHLLVVHDEYGAVTGVVTLEDLVETLIGIEIVDEVDQIDDLRRLARQQWKTRATAMGIDPDDVATWVVEDDSPQSP